VFAIDTRNSTGEGVEPGFRSGFGAVDFALQKYVTVTDDWRAVSRLTQGKQLQTQSTAAETTLSYAMFDYSNGWSAADGTNSNLYSWMWKRAPGYFDVVAYTGNGTRGHAVSHNLGVAPEMIWVKNRDQPDFWVVYHSALGNDTKLILNNTGGPSGSDFVWWAKTDPTDSVFSVGESGRVNGSGEDLIAYLFASLPGISKVGSYSGDGTTDGSKVIDCGFTSGARFVLIKTSNTAGDWMVYDTVRGIVAGNDPVLSLNSTAAEATTYDNLIPNSSGFAVIQNTDGAYTTNESGHSYIFYAIA
jgi:hypothetical protein